MNKICEVLNLQNVLRIITIFPNLFDSFSTIGVVGKAIQSNKVTFSVEDLRNFGIGKHMSVDDTQYGGGPGMVMRPEPFYDSVESLKNIHNEKPYIILTSPKGNTLDSKKIKQLSKKNCIYILCGRYEGVDQRVQELIVDEEISIGNYILSGGEIPAMVIADSIIRKIPNVLGSSESTLNETFSENIFGKNKEPVYTKPRTFKHLSVPKVLLEGNHKKIEEWRKKMRK
ncbi:MAG: tRNA (guanosine(37)-N1)-methyltransferase TrmD [Chloroflexota bacterium]|nr:tRNA (guanosine(37)-N1)-methyltransferase TrmD [Chloroflexota bacterium]|tara:strand:- start:24 stop:707 length:684 start_codon:yes stop_codon:yes gene_type:complete